jgi:hypothetical protein
MDFKGNFATGDGKRCDPFTITDAHSRYLIRCQIVSRMDLSQVRAICEAAMREYGVPARIRTDNGAPFAGTGLLGMSKLSLGWMKLGIVHERIQAGRPQQNGRHERMHRTLKEDTTKPPAASLRAQQSRFDNFRYVFNNKRPHESLNNQVPASLYHPSSVRLPRKLPEFTYPKGLLLRRVNNSGDISWHKSRIFVRKCSDLRFSASSRSKKTSTRSIFGMLRLVSLMRKSCDSGPFRSCDECLAGVTLRVGLEVSLHGDRSYRNSDLRGRSLTGGRVVPSSSSGSNGVASIWILDSAVIHRRRVFRDLGLHGR